jgi:phosphatidylinositol kinase/protein kinase (PI-3  family)
MSWFAMRLNYTRSVATTSIVGHILGLGDRHTSNILIESSTGEVVHIDLGIAFEQVFFFALLSLPLPHKCCHTRESYSQSQS